MLVLN